MIYTQSYVPNRSFNARQFIIAIFKMYEIIARNYYEVIHISYSKSKKMKYNTTMGNEEQDLETIRTFASLSPVKNYIDLGTIKPQSKTRPVLGR